MHNITKPKTLLIVIPSLHIGGAETHLSQILPGLKDQGWDITIYLTSGTGELTQQLATAGIHIICPNKLTTKLHNRSKLLRAPLVCLTFINLTMYLLKNKPSIVQFMLPEAYLIGGLSGILTKQPNMLMSRRSLNNYQQKYPLLAKLEQWLHRKMRYIITNSQANIDQLSNTEHVPVNKLKLIYNGIDINKFNNLHLPTSGLTLIVIANIIPYKGHITLLQALAQIKDQLPADWQLLCVGEKYDYVEELILAANNLQISSHIHWLGAQKSVEKLLAISDIAISCSYEEGFSNAVIEAMAAGLPLIVTNVGGNPEAVLDGQTGLVIPAKDAAALGAAIVALAGNAARREAMGAAGRQRVQEYFSLAACVANYDELYTKLLRPYD